MSQKSRACQRSLEESKRKTWKQSQSSLSLDKLVQDLPEETVEPGQLFSCYCFIVLRVRATPWQMQGKHFSNWVCVCTSMHICEGANAHMCSCMWRPEDNFRHSSRVIHLVFWDKVYNLVCNSPVRLGWLACRPQGPARLCLASLARIIGILHHAQVFFL